MWKNESAHTHKKHSQRAHATRQPSYSTGYTTGRTYILTAPGPTQQRPICMPRVMHPSDFISFVTIRFHGSLQPVCFRVHSHHDLHICTSPHMPAAPPKPQLGTSHGKYKTNSMYTHQQPLQQASHGCPLLNTPMDSRTRGCAGLLGWFSALDCASWPRTVQW